MCLKLNAPSLRSLCLQSTPLWSRVGSRPPTRAKRASFPRTTSRTCERHHDVITPSLCNSELYLKTSGGGGQRRSRAADHFYLLCNCDSH